MKWFLSYSICLCAITGSAENLLANPGFDELTLKGAPAEWDLFVMPGNEAIGKADSVAHDGDFAAMLATPKRYAKEPLNNWSQIIYDDLAGQAIELSGHIRTESVTEAALWIQCFSKQRSRILATASSFKDFPLYGTQGWTAVSTSLTPPVGTDFIVIRCVMTGEGKAWFDSLQLTATAPTLTVDPVDLPAIEEYAEPEPVSAIDPAEVIEVSKLIQDTIRQLEADNQELMVRIAEIQGDLNRYRTELVGQSAELTSALPRYGKHPLVPHGYSLELDFE